MNRGAMIKPQQKRTTNDDLQRLSQKETLDYLRLQTKSTDELEVYKSQIESGQHSYGIFSILIPNDFVAECMLRRKWDMNATQALPSAIDDYTKETPTRYLRYGNEFGGEPLVISRYFSHLKETQIDINEEFKLFHNLYYKKESEQYIKFDENGQETVIATVKNNIVKIRVLEIRQFLAIKEMHLVVQYDLRELSSHSLEDLGLKRKIEDDKHEPALCWNFHYADRGNYPPAAYSRLEAKKLIYPVPKEKSGFYGFSEVEKEEAVQFIIGETSDGDVIEHTSDENELSNDFSDIDDKPKYLTPVFFRKEVLDKYHQKPSKYTISAASLCQSGIWSIDLDMEHRNIVCAWLGDLGNRLPKCEQLHFKSHNIAPTGTMSETFFRQQCLNQWISSNRPEEVFKKEYLALDKVSNEILGWSIFLPLGKGDQHHLDSLRVATTDEQRDFDELILSLTKILIDSLNEDELKLQITSVQPLDSGGINLLEAVLKGKNIPDSETHIKLLRTLQGLRSSGSAHRKGDRYSKVLKKANLSTTNRIDAFQDLLLQSVELITFVKKNIEGMKFTPKKP